MKRIILALALLTVLNACKKEKELDNSSEEIYTNLSYGQDAAQKMDVYLPASRTESTPLVVMFHGGAWVDGDKADLNFIQDSLLHRGIATVNVNYRFASSSNHYEGMMSDVSAALSYVKKNADEWNVRQSGDILLGVSAGGHIALLYAYAYKQPGEVNAVISLAGPSIFSSEYLSYASAALKQPLEYMAGAEISGSVLNEKFAEASPANRISNVPTLLIHGTADVVVPIAQSEFLDQELSAHKIDHKLVSIQGAGHDLSISNPASINKITSEVVAWVGAYSK